MHITTRTRYGIRAMIEMARNFDNGYISIKDLAACEHLSAKYLEQIFIALKASGLVRSTRGARGGYRLSKKPEDVKLIEIFSALEGSLSLVECVEAPERCDQQDRCTVRELWTEINVAIYDILAHRTLSDFLQ